MATRKTGNVFTELRKRVRELELQMENNNKNLVTQGLTYEQWENARYILYNDIVNLLEDNLDTFKKIKNHYNEVL